MKTEICEQLGIEFPIFAFTHCRDVAAAVSKAGGFGVLGALTFTPEELEQELAWIDDNVDGKPYGVDIVIPANYVGRDQGDMSKAQLEQMVPKEHREFLENLLKKHRVPPLPEDVKVFDSLLGWSNSTGQAHLDVALNHPVKLVVNALGPPPAEAITKCHDKGVLVGALIGSVEHAVAQKEAGVDVIIASGTEAGGHTGEVTSMVLTPQVVDAVAPLPVLTAGGIGSGRQMAAAMMLGAQGVWTGSIWLTVSESEEPETLTSKLLAATSRDTIRSRCLTGKPARQLKTTYTMAWEEADAPDPLPMPLQFMAVAEANNRIYKHSMTSHETAGDLVGIAVGQVVGMMNQRKPARELIYEFVNDYIEIVEQRAGELAAAAE